MAVYRSDPSREPLLEEGGLVTFDEDDIKQTVIRRNKKSKQKFVCYVIVSVVLILMFGVALFMLSGDINDKHHHNNADFPPSKSILGKYRKAAIASDNKICSTIGRKILEEKKGSSIDAAIAVMLCYGVTDPHSSGIGGGFFMTIYDRNAKKSVVFDARETAPANATEDMFKDVPSDIGGLSIAVPGEVRGYQKLCQTYNCLPWKELAQPSIDLARKGFPLSANTARAIASSKEKINANAALKKTYTNKKTGELYKVGEIATFPLLADTLETIAKEGPQTFYNGTLSQKILLDLQEGKSIIQASDLENYSVLKKQAASSILLDGSTAYTAPAPSGGVVWLFIMNIMDGYKITPETILSTKKELLTYHRLIEAFKFAYALRTDLADPNFDSNVTAVVEKLVSRSYADSVRKKIWDNQTHDTMYYGPTFYDKLKTSTAHLSVLGNDGIAVAVTTTINTVFASGVMGSRTGIIFNNEMDDFSSPNITNHFNIEPSPANFIKPGKRPLSSMSPSIVVSKDNLIKLVIGAAGGSHITTAVSYISMRVLWFGETIKQAIDAARLHHQLLPPYVYAETEFPKHYVDGLRQLGHNVSDTPAFRTDANGITSNNGWLYANCDVRRGGAPDGF